MIEAKTLAAQLRDLGLTDQAQQADNLAGVPGMPESIVLGVLRTNKDLETPYKFALTAYDFVSAAGEKIKTADDFDLGRGGIDYGLDFDLGGARVTVYKTMALAVDDDWAMEGEDDPESRRLTSLTFVIQDISGNRGIRNIRNRGLFNGNIDAVRINLDPLSLEFGSVEEPVTWIDQRNRRVVAWEGRTKKGAHEHRVGELAELLFNLLKDSPRFRTAE